MATTEIPAIYGIKSSKSLFSNRYLRKGNLWRLHSGADDKAHRYIHLNIENEILRNSNPADEGLISLDDTILQENPVFPTARCPETCDTSIFPIEFFMMEAENKKKERCTGVSHNFADYLNQRSQGHVRNQFRSVNNDYGAFEMIRKQLFNQRLLRIGDVNKVFCSQWLTSDQIIMGTKCNQLLVYDVNSKKIDEIPSLGHESDHLAGKQCGIHALEQNPSKTLLATGARNSHEVAIYRLPTLDPVCMGENAHLDWVFDLCWMDDEFLVSCSRDKSLAIWRIDESADAGRSPHHEFIEPLSRKVCCGADKVRAVIFNPNYMEIVALSLNAKIHIWDATQFQQVMSQKLELVNENVCLAKTENCSMYAVGSKSHVTLIDPRTLQSIRKIDTQKSGPNIRSMSFRDSLLTIGTGSGDILFYDVQAGRCLDQSQQDLELKCSKCPVTLEDSSRAQQYPPPLPDASVADSAVYTHCYDWSGTRLFAAGGPLSSEFKGCFASLWC